MGYERNGMENDEIMVRNHNKAKPFDQHESLYN